MARKQKTHKGAKKRMKVTRNGKVMRSRANRSHLLSGRKSKNKRQARTKVPVAGKQEKTYRELMQ